MSFLHSWLFNYFLNGFWFLSSFCYFLRITFSVKFWRQLQNICLEIKVMTTLQSQPQCQTPQQNFCWGSRERNTRRFSQGAIIAFLWFSLSQTKVWILDFDLTLNGFWHSKGFVAFFTLFEKSNFCPKIQFWPKPQHFHEFFTPNCFYNFSREFKVVNS